MDKLIELVEGYFKVAPLCVAALILIIAAWYSLRLYRDHLLKTEFRPADYLKSFQKLHEEGELSNEEYRIIRRIVSLQPTRNTDEPTTDYSLLNKTSPSKTADLSSGNILKN